MLPFRKRNDEASASLPIDVIERKPDEPKEDDHLESAMEELHSALMDKRYKDAADIFRACFELMDSEPHVEGPHINKE